MMSQSVLELLLGHELFEWESNVEAHVQKGERKSYSKIHQSLMSYIMSYVWLHLLPWLSLLVGKFIGISKAGRSSVHVYSLAALAAAVFLRALCHLASPSSRRSFCISQQPI